MGFVPDKESNYKVRKVVGEVGRIFSDLSIPVRWIKPESFHITLYYLGENLSVFQRLVLKKKIARLKFKKFSVSLSNVKVGISRKYKELIYIDIEDGGEELRGLLLEVRKQFRAKDASVFVPHLTIGRISKDLSKEEYRNVVKDISNISDKLEVKEIRFDIEEMHLIESKDGNYSFKMKFEAS